MPLLPTGHPLTASLARILNGRGLPIGAGFLVADRLLCTCAHVVADALGLTVLPRTSPPDELLIDLPALSANPLRAKIFAWYPDTDLALLQLNGPLPSAAQLIPLIAPRLLAGRSFTTCGFPQGHTGGRWAYGKLGNYTPGGLIQLLPESATHPWIAPGFSGGPIWDIGGEGVVGLVVAKSDGAAWGLPLSELLARAPQLAEHVRLPADAFTALRLGQQLAATGFRPLSELNQEYAARFAQFDFSAARWHTGFTFVIGVVRGDGLAPAALAACCTAFADLNDQLYRKPGLFQPGWIDWMLSTHAALLCVLFEQGSSLELRTIVANAQRMGPTYVGGAAPAIQTIATTLCWSIDVPARQLYTNPGRRGGGWNLHTRWTNQTAEEIEALVREQLIASA